MVSMNACLNTSNNGTVSYLFNPTATSTSDDVLTFDKLMHNLTYTWGCDKKEIEIEVPFGKRTIIIKKQITLGDKIKITEEDISNAFAESVKKARFEIIVKRAERKAEDLLQSFISEIDFRNYKQKGHFLVRSGNRLFKIYKDNRKWIDMWELNKLGQYIPKNRLCTHTQSRDIPKADEALSKLMLIRSNQILDHSNLHSINSGSGHYIGEDMNIIAKNRVKELITC